MTGRRANINPLEEQAPEGSVGQFLKDNLSDTLSSLELLRRGKPTDSKGSEPNSPPAPAPSQAGGLASPHPGCSFSSHSCVAWQDAFRRETVFCLFSADW